MNMKKKEFPYHPFEIIFSGLSGSGKTTLLEKIIGILAQKYKVAYVKHDAHGFEMDRPGKDSFRARAAGASCVLISDQGHSVFTQNGALRDFAYQDRLLDSDFCLVEGHKDVHRPKIVVVDEKEEILERVNLEDVIAFVVSDKKENLKHLGLPVFQRDEVGTIASFVLDYLLKKAALAPLYGLILSGGKSTRMGQDKGALDYHGRSQSEYLFGKVQSLTEKCFVSCTLLQKDLPHLKALPQIHDMVESLGPAGGIFSAMMTYPKARWLVIAVDMPLVTHDHLQSLIKEAHPFALASGHVDSEDLPEPLSAIYRPEFRHKLFAFLAREMLCPRKMLLNVNFHTVKGHEPEALMNANTTDDFEAIQKRLKNKIEIKGEHP